MELTTGFKQTEVGVIPKDWVVKKLGEIGESLIGLTYSPVDVRPQGTLVLRSSNVQNNALNFEDSVFVEADVPQRIMVKGGDLLICVRNGSRELIGKCALLDDRVHGMTFGAFMAVFRSKHGKILHQIFQSRIIKKQINEHLGATINQITNKSLNSFSVPLPPGGSEQYAIARALSDVDALIEALDLLLIKKRDIKQATMQQLLTGQTRLPGFGGEWHTKPLPDVLKFCNGKAHEQYISNTGSYICVNSKFISTEGKVRKYSSVNFCPAKRGDILMVMSDLPNGRALAKAYFVEEDDKYAVNQRICRLTSYHDCSQYLFYTLNRNPYFLAFDDGVSQTHLLNNIFQKCQILLPGSVEEQRAIASILSEMDVELAALENRRDKTILLKQGMMQELLTGKTRLI